jgi:tRNA 2-thiouridine synthesizing protein A
MAAPPGAVLVDARGMRCPWPALRAARAIRDGATGVTVLADDPAAAREIGAVAAAQGWTLTGADGRFDLLPSRTATSPLLPGG